MLVKKVLLLVDGSFISFVVNFRAFKQWTEQYQAIDSCAIRPPDETDQDNLPDLVNESQWFKKCLRNAALDKLNGIANIIENSKGLIYPNSTLVDTIIAKDTKLTKSFRYEIYPEYKLSRKIQRSRKSQYKIGPVFDELYMNVYPSIFGENTWQLSVPGAEGDDIIASLAMSGRVMEKYSKVIIISSDRDFVQLQMTNEELEQYDAKGERVEPVLKRGTVVERITPSQALMVKIISGDQSDNIKPIKPKVGAITALKYITEKTEEFKKMLRENPEVAEKFLMNTKLIDFRNIPEELQQMIVGEFFKLVG